MPYIIQNSNTNESVLINDDLDDDNIRQQWRDRGFDKILGNTGQTLYINDKGDSFGLDYGSEGSDQEASERGYRRATNDESYNILSQKYNEEHPIKSGVETVVNATGRSITAIPNAAEAITEKIAPLITPSGLETNEEGVPKTSFGERFDPRSYDRDAQILKDQHPILSAIPEVVGALAPTGTGLPGAIGRAGLFGTLTENEQAFAENRQFSPEQALFNGVLGEVLGYGAGKAIGGLSKLASKTGGALEELLSKEGIADDLFGQASKKSTKSLLQDATSEIDPALQGAKKAATIDTKFSEIADDLSNHFKNISEKLEKQEAQAFSKSNIAKNLNDNLGGQQNAFTASKAALDVLRAQLNKSVPEEQALLQLLDSKAYKLNASEPSVMYAQLKKLSNALEGQSNKIQSPAFQDFSKNLDNVLQDEITWGKNAKNYQEFKKIKASKEAFQNAHFDNEIPNPNRFVDSLNGGNGKTSLDQYLDDLQSFNKNTNQNDGVRKLIDKARSVAQEGYEWKSAAASSKYAQSVGNKETRDAVGDTVKNVAEGFAKNVAEGFVKKAIKWGMKTVLNVAGISHFGPAGVVLSPLINKGVEEGANYVFQKAIPKAIPHLVEMSKGMAVSLNTAGRAMSNPAVGRAVANITRPIASIGISRFMGESSSPSLAFQEKRQNLSSIQSNPIEFTQHLTEQFEPLHEVSPRLYNQVQSQTWKVVSFLNSKMPATIGTSLTRKDGNPPSKLAIRQFALYYTAATDPSSVIEDIKIGKVTHEQIDTLREVWPNIYSDLKIEILQGLSNSRPTLNQKVRLDNLFNYDKELDTAFTWSLGVAAQKARDNIAKMRPSPRQSGSSTSRSIRSNKPQGLESLENSQTMT